MKGDPSPREKIAQTTATSGRATMRTEAIISPVIIALLTDRQLRFAVRSGGVTISTVKSAALTSPARVFIDRCTIPVATRLTRIVIANNVTASAISADLWRSWASPHSLAMTAGIELPGANARRVI